MAQARSFVHRGNPFRSDATWRVVLIQGLVALGIGLYSLFAEDSARQTIMLLIGLFLLLNGLQFAWQGVRKQGDRTDGMREYQLVRSGIGIATGLIVVIDRVRDFMGIDAARVVAGLGLVGMGLVTVVGIVATRAALGWRVATLGGALLLAAWGVVVLYGASNDSRATELIGWSAVLIGAAMIAIAGYRRQRTLTAIPRSARS